jgi:AcrR family transcriptional regulator
MRTEASRPKARATRARLLAAAAAEVAERGYDATTSTVVAQRAGVSTGTFYAYFRDKEDVLAALFATALDELLDAVEATLTADNLLDHGLDATLGKVVELVAAGYRRHAPVIRAALARMTASTAIREVYWTRHDRAVAVAERFARRGVAAGLVREGSPPMLAQTLVVVVQAVNHPVALGEGDEPAAIRQEVATALARTLSPARA